MGLRDRSLSKGVCAAARHRGDPLNLIRVMPAKGRTSFARHIRISADCSDKTRRSPMNKQLSPSDLATPKVTTGPLPASRKIYVAPEAAPDLRVPVREIALTEAAGEPPLPVYDTSGPYTDPDVVIDVEQGPRRARRSDWVRERGGVEEYDGRAVKPRTTAMSGKHARARLPERAPAAARPSATRRSRNTNGPRRHHHQGDDLRRRARESRPQAACSSAPRRRSPTARASAPRCPPSSRRNSCATRSRAAAPSSRPTSTTPNSSR